LRTSITRRPRAASGRALTLLGLPRDLVPDELVALEQSVAQRLDHVPLSRDDLPGASRAETRKASIAWRLGSSERACSPGRRGAGRLERDQAARHPVRADHLGGQTVARLGRRTALCPAPRRRSPPPPSRPLRSAKSSHSLRVCVKRSSAPECDNNPRASRRLMIERTSRLRPGAASGRQWRGPLRGWLWSGAPLRCTSPVGPSRVPRSSGLFARLANPFAPSATQRPHQGLVEEVLEHYR